jgi:steroid 5-alpha reductase family enzyme
MKRSYRHNEVVSALICLSAYCAAFLAAGAFIFLARIDSPIAAVFGADMTATAVVFCFSLAFNNSSIYDPYWSVAPPAIAIYWAFAGGARFSPRIMIVILLVTIWGVRLTYNWFRQWRGLVHEDWRYAEIRSKAGRWYWASSLVGIHYFPTLIVFFACLPLYRVMSASGRGPGILDAAGLVVTTGAIAVEALADRQLHTFVRSRPRTGAVLSTGLWACSRHPNYFGEAAFWWGLFLFSSASGQIPWWTVPGPVAVTLMFLLVSIPMMERHMRSKRPDYDAHKQRVPVFFPWFPKKKS